MTDRTLHHDQHTTYLLELWRWGFLGKIEVHPLRQVQALIRHRAATLAS